MTGKSETDNMVEIGLVISSLNISFLKVSWFIHDVTGLTHILGIAKVSDIYELSN